MDSKKKLIKRLMARVGYYEIDSLRRENVASENTQLTESVILVGRRRKLFKEELVCN